MNKKNQIWYQFVSLDDRSVIRVFFSFHVASKGKSELIKKNYLILCFFERMLGCLSCEISLIRL